MPVDLIAQFECRRGRRAAVLQLLADYAGLVTRSAGTLRFEVYTEESNLDRVLVIERYVDGTAFQAHLADPANGQFNRELGPLIVGGGSQLTLLSAVGAEA
jgi:quinol monooxygenase YgiN